MFIPVLYVNYLDLFVASIHLHVRSTPWMPLAVPSVQLRAIGHDALFFVGRWTMILRFVPVPTLVQYFPAGQGAKPYLIESLCRLVRGIAAFIITRASNAFSADLGV